MKDDNQAYQIIEENVKALREELRPQTEGSNPLHPNYTGLCYQATSMFLGRMTDVCYDKQIALECESIHGEQRHTPEVPSKYWGNQHQWCWVKLLGKKYYVDCTSGQFRDLYNDIPDYYISAEKPRWFYEDSRNPANTKWNQRLIVDQHIVCTDWGYNIEYTTLVEYIQYQIWGPISDLIRKIRRIKK